MMTPNRSESRDTHREFASVRIGEDGLAEMDGQRRLLFIPKNEVHGLELVHASGAERPILTVLVGVVVLLVALFPFVFLFFVFMLGGHMEVHLFWLSAFGILGVWLLNFAIRSRYVLLVHTPAGRRKLVFHQSAAGGDVVRFVTEVALQFQYVCSVREDIRFK
jgi:hypothetical protein